ncbi:MraY family glycosyltransferase [Sulfoacidibacillus thermotolerans]|nr:MraY family glycosyltransferase [Sulfoacidibacillus thermotolerans]
MSADFIAFSLSFGLVYFLVPLMRHLALHTGFVDMPTERKVHKAPLPMLGGAAMIIGFITVTIAVHHFLFALRLDKPFLGMITGATVMFAIGMVDDYAKTRKRDFPAWPKFFIQILAAFLLIYCGGVIRGVQDPFHPAYYFTFPHWLADFLTVFWITGIVNVFNFLDGLDGLAGGIAIFASATLLIASLVKGDVSSALSAASLIGVTLAFLRFNFYPARIIMGDAGSTFVGYVLAAIAVTGAFKSATAISILVPIFALGVPIFDAIYVVIRRMLEHRPVYKADRSHGHYRLMAAGFSQLQTVSLIYLVSLAFSVISIALLLLTR